jgi:uncharacterized membrane protein
VSKRSPLALGQLRALWDRIHNSIWFVPTAMAVGSLMLAWLTVWLDKRFEDDDVHELWFVMDVGSEGARGVLQAISGSMITVTGTVFSITIIVLQLASQQYTPRVLRSFTTDRFTHVVLGTLIGTFTYTILVQRTVRSSNDDAEAFVPIISVSIAVVLALVSILLLVVFIHSIAQSVRASAIINSVAKDISGVIERLFPEQIGEPAPEDEAGALESTPVGRMLSITTDGGGYLQAVDDNSLFELADEGRFAVRMEKRIGDFLLPGEVIATAWLSRDAEPRKIEKQVLEAFVIGDEKTLQQDVERGIIELLDIAVRALSPSLNDPTTAILAIDRLAEALVRIGTRRFPPLVRTDDEHQIRFIARRHEYDELVTLAFDQIRHHGRDNYVILVRLAEVMGRVALQVPEARRGRLREEVERVRRTAEEHVSGAESQEAVFRAVDRARERLRSGRASPERGG